MSWFHWNLVLLHELTNQKNWLTFGERGSDTDSGPLSYFLRYCGIVDFTRFISISHTVTTRLLPDLSKWLWRRQGNESATFWQRSSRHPDLNNTNWSGNPDLNTWSLWVKCWRLYMRRCALSLSEYSLDLALSVQTVSKRLHNSLA